MRKIEELEKELGGSPCGTVVYRLIYKHFEEVMRLVTGSRPVMVGWQRNKGPAFIAALADKDFNRHTKLRKEVDGVTLDRLLIRMADLLQENGSYALAGDIGRYSTAVFNSAHECECLQDVLDKIGECEAADILNL